MWLVVGNVENLNIIIYRQRGSFSIDKPGDSSCYHRTPECGNIAPGIPKTQYYVS
jgi:hypothetical protein